jgi:23S rRNA pseudouridine1911/1915/1917 synthase
MLHAVELGFEHPTTDEPLHFHVPPPADFCEMLARLRGSRRG